MIEKVGVKKEKKEDINHNFEFGINLEEMAEAGVYFGHTTSKINPKMRPYIWGTRNDVDIINLNATAKKLIEALKFIQGIVRDGKILLFVGTKIQTKDLVKEVAEDCGFPYVTNRWLGGTFTNFKTVLGRIKRLNDLEKKMSEGALEKYTKKEKAQIMEEIETLNDKFGGIRNLTSLPDAIFSLNMNKDYLAVKEARMKGIKVIGVCDTDVDPSLADYPIPANDDAVSSVRYILDKVKSAILEAKQKPVE